MLGRLGFTGRLMAIVLFALVALWAVSAGWLFVSESRDDLVNQLFPLPEQVGAIAQLIETVEPEQRAAVLKAVSSESLQVTLSHVRPIEPPNTRHFPLVEHLLTLYFGVLRPRDVIILGDGERPFSWRDWHFGDYWRRPARSQQFAVSLRTGDYLIFDVRGPIGRRIFGLPPGFGVGALGALIGMAAVIAIAREARPLRALSKALAQFRGDAVMPILRPVGAPEIRRLMISVNEMQARIAELIQGRTLLLGAVSHDLKTYITRLRLRVEQLPDEIQHAKAASDLDEMTGLLEDALAVSRGALATARRAKIDLRALLSAIVEDRWLAKADISADIDSGPIWIMADAVALRRLFSNLVDNALSFATRCVIRVQRDDGCIIAVDDNGPGIPPDARDSVASRSRSTGGSGLGLAIVKQIADAHNIRLELGASPEDGLRVSVDIRTLLV